MVTGDIQPWETRVLARVYDMVHTEVGDELWVHSESIVARISREVWTVGCETRYPREERA
jgi:hypothetical protein